MTNDKQQGVVEQMAQACAFAYRAHTPLIFLDTQDMELILRVILACGKREEKDFLPLKTEGSVSDALAPFYHYLKDDEVRLDRCVNLAFTAEKLKTFPKDEKGNPIPIPHLFLLHLDRTCVEETGLLRGFVREYIHALPSSVVRNSCVLLYGDMDVLDEDLKCRTEVVEEPYPKAWELEKMLRRELEQQQLLREDVARFVESRDFAATVTALTGLRFLQAERVIHTLLLPEEDGLPLLFFPERRVEVVRREKEKILRQSGGVLELVDVGQQSVEPCGMENFTAWIDRSLDRLKDPRAYAERRGAPSLKGTLMCGVPGCGKSEAARWLGSKMELPLVKLNMDRLMAGLVGQSEQNLRTALSIAEAMAPCIVWVDELDKVIMSANSASRQDPTSSRMLSRLLQWMQSNRHGCFIFATANNISLLPPELLRRGRFDTLWSVFLPTQRQCVKIFEDHMKLAERLRCEEARNAGHCVQRTLFSREGEKNCFSKKTMNEILGYFIERKKFLTGADIAGIVSDALTRLEDQSFAGEIDADMWKTAVEKVAQELNTDVTGPDSLNKMAANYIRLMRYSILPASEQLLFDPAYYCVDTDDTQDGRLTAAYTGPVPGEESPYDQALFHALNTVINRNAADYERLLVSRTFS